MMIPDSDVSQQQNVHINRKYNHLRSYSSIMGTAPLYPVHMESEEEKKNGHGGGSEDDEKMRRHKRRQMSISYVEDVKNRKLSQIFMDGPVIEEQSNANKSEASPESALVALSELFIENENEKVITGAMN
mmetsp:Transcript_42444/g.70032  ORF Transcript_42444/g.70032 Transcript_42444/m.70032 type:complete len:130 (+) Transcript_42444:1-390(+)